MIWLEKLIIRRLLLGAISFMLPCAILVECKRSATRSKWRTIIRVSKFSLYHLLILPTSKDRAGHNYHNNDQRMLFTSFFPVLVHITLITAHPPLQAKISPLKADLTKEGLEERTHLYSSGSLFSSGWRNFPSIWTLCLSIRKLPVWVSRS